MDTHDKGEITVFIVEDREITRTGLKHILERTGGFKVVGEATDAQTALARVVELKPDAVLMDVGLPVKDGIEATTELKEMVPDANVMLLTTQGTGVNIAEILKAGAQGHCNKGVSGNQLAMAVSTVARGGAWFDNTYATDFLQRAVDPSQDDDSEPDPAALESCGYGLTQREAEVLHLATLGLCNADIAAKLELSGETVKTHMRHVMEKLGVRKRVEAVVIAIRESKAYDSARQSFPQPQALPAEGE